MAKEPYQAARLPRRLRELRETYWADTASLTQEQLATAFSTETKVSRATISTWESINNPKTPTSTRLDAYARFFATRRSLEGRLHLVPEAELDEEEHEQYLALRDELLGLAEGTAPEPEGARRKRRSTFAFDEGPVTVICSEAPREVQGQLAREKDPNFTKLQQYGDLDALIEIYGHLRAFNASLDVFHRVAGDVDADDLSTHVILLGGIAWNKVTKRFQEATRQVPITQIEVDDYDGGDPFEVAPDTKAQDDKRATYDKEAPDGRGKRFEPLWEDNELAEDIAFLARIPNPFNTSRTLTICNGVHSRGVLGAVRCLTDSRVREGNEQYLTDRFPDGRFALLLRVPVIDNKTLSPDLQNSTARLYEWPYQEGVRG